MASNYDSQFTYENDDYELPDLFSEFVPATESIDEEDYDDDIITEDEENDAIFEQGQFDQYAEQCDVDEARGEIESDVDNIFDFNFFNDISPATESLEDDLEELGDMDGTNEDEEEPDDTEEDSEPEDDGGDEPDEGGEDDTPDDLAAATDEQLEEDNQSPEDDMSEENVDDATDSTDDISSDDTLGSDPLKSIETKTAYRDKFVIMYQSITDSMTILEDFTPEFNSEASSLYYTCKRNFSTLRDQIYKICVKRMNHITVDEVLRQYTECVLTYDSIMRDIKTFSENYTKEQKAIEAKEHRKSKSSPKNEKDKQSDS